MRLEMILMTDLVFLRTNTGQKKVTINSIKHELVKYNKIGDRSEAQRKNLSYNTTNTLCKILIINRLKQIKQKSSRTKPTV